MPACTAKRKIEQIYFYGGRYIHFIERRTRVYAASRAAGA